jgi:tetrahydromethanopterin S-methyltransferase subunit C
MSEHRTVETDAAPVGEHIHMPAPSILPFLNAIGLACAIVGITEGLFLVIGGLILFLSTTAVWIRDTVREVNDLPLDHH